MFKVLVIGDGGGFDVDKVNSSFLIIVQTGHGVYASKISRILFDCGYNVFTELKNHYSEELRKIDYVYITHMHDDHVGSLKTLLSYSFNELGRKLTVVAASPIKEWLSAYISDRSYRGVGRLRIPWANLISTDEFNEAHSGMHIVPVQAIHAIPTYGAFFADLESLVGISGDTRANPLFYQAYKDLAGAKRHILFHDLGEISDPVNAVHAYKEELLYAYPEEFIRKLHFYHNKESDLAGKTFEV